jgi:hypothetical protein
MNRVCLTKDGKLIEMQGGGDDDPTLMDMRLNALTQNALNAGYTADQVDARWVTDEEWATIQEAQPKPDPPSDPLSDLIVTLINNGTLPDGGTLPASISSMAKVATAVAAKTSVKTAS